jgi:1,4-alpha-glucan branching enzyme
MGGEFGQMTEWNHEKSLDWHLLESAPHRGLQQLMEDLNALYRKHEALWEADVEPVGFQWSVVNDSDQSVAAFIRYNREQTKHLVCVINATPVVRHGYRIGVPAEGEYREVLNSDAAKYAGSNVGNHGGAHAHAFESHDFPYSMEITLPPLAVVIFEGPPPKPAEPKGEAPGASAAMKVAI